MWIFRMQKAAHQAAPGKSAYIVGYVIYDSMQGVFEVDSLEEAFDAVNYLNGGKGARPFPLAATLRSDNGSLHISLPSNSPHRTGSP
jgi:hypothetical protein